MKNLFKKIETISTSLLSKKDKKNINRIFNADIIPKDQNYELMKLKNKTSIILDENSKAILFSFNNKYLPTIKSIEMNLFTLPCIFLDEGAIGPLHRGANVMAPGVFKYINLCNENFRKNDIVAIEVINNGLIGIGLALVGKNDITKTLAGEVIEVLHIRFDELYSSDYNETILRNSDIQTTTCTNCNNDALLKYVRLKEIEPEVVLVVFECKNCNIKDTTIFNEKSNEKKLIIECNFTNKADLKREINLNLHAKTIVIYKGVEYEHESSQPIVTTIEGIIDGAIEALGNQNNAFIGDHEKLKETLDTFKGLKNDPMFYMRIEDSDGLTRIARIGKGVYEMQNCSLEEYNDEKVSHRFV